MAQPGPGGLFKPKEPVPGLRKSNASIERAYFKLKKAHREPEMANIVLKWMHLSRDVASEVQRMPVHP